MGIEILHDARDRTAALTCGSTGVAFGPLFYEEGDLTASELAEKFLAYLGRDARGIPVEELVERKTEFMDKLPSILLQEAADKEEAEREEDEHDRRWQEYLEGKRGMPGVGI